MSELSDSPPLKRSHVEVLERRRDHLARRVSESVKPNSWDQAEVSALRAATPILRAYLEGKR
jgi:hypothetical protein